MNWIPLQTAAQFSVEHILNVLPEGLLIAFFAWGLLRVLRGQNSGTRFAVWFLALLAIAALPFLGGISSSHAIFGAGTASGAWGSMHPAINLPAQWALFVFLIWALGACFATARLASGLWRLGRLRRSCTPIYAADLDPALRKTLEAISAAGATVASSSSARVPAAIGFWKRTIVLPAWTLREMAVEDLNVILLHEFAHLRRGDDWTNLIQKVVRALFFFHPAVWWIESRLSVEREMACDDAVLAETFEPAWICELPGLAAGERPGASPAEWPVVDGSIGCASRARGIAASGSHSRSAEASSYAHLEAGAGHGRSFFRGLPCRVAARAAVRRH